MLGPLLHVEMITKMSDNAAINPICLSTLL